MREAHRTAESKDPYPSQKTRRDAIDEDARFSSFLNAVSRKCAAVVLFWTFEATSRS